MKARRRTQATARVDTVKVGNIGVKVYTRTRRTATGKRELYEVADYTKGRRRLRGFSDKAKAKAEAKRLASLLSTGDATAAQIRNPDAASYGRALELLRPTGTPLELAAAHYAEACRILGSDKVIQAAKFYAKASPDKLEPRTVAEVVDELLQSKEGRREKNTVDDLRARLTTFADAFRVQISAVLRPMGYQTTTQPDRPQEAPQTHEKGTPLTARQAARLDQVSDCLPSYKTRYRRLFAGLSNSRKEAVTLFCIECQGYSRDGISDCKADACALWGVRPYQKTG